MTRCAAALSSSLLLAMTVSAQPQSGPQDLSGEVRDLGGEVLDLEGKPLDLSGEVTSLKREAEPVSGRSEGLAVRETPGEVHLDLAADVLFDFGAATLRPQAQETLRRAAEVIRERAAGTVRIEGHTDAKGSAAYNQRLSERRARAVKDWLAGQPGLERVRFVTRGWGASRPVAPNTRPDGSDDPQGRQRNRRVEIIIVKG